MELFDHAMDASRYGVESLKPPDRQASVQAKAKRATAFITKQRRCNTDKIAANALHLKDRAMSGLFGQLVGVALIYLAFKLLKRYADRQEPPKKHLSNGKEQRRTTNTEDERKRPNR